MDSLTITIITIVVVTFLSAFIKGRKIDRCLKRVNGYFIHVYNSKEISISGRAEVASNSIIIDYNDGNELENKKFILYKSEFKNMQLILSLQSHFNDVQKIKREKIHKKAMNPGIFSRLKRKFRNIFTTTKDAINEIINLLLASAKSMGPIKSLPTEDNQVNRLKDESLGTLTGNAFEPIWEKCIGKQVGVEIIEDESLNIQGTLIEYSQSYILLFDSTLNGLKEDRPHDLLINREYGTIRHIIN